VILLSEEFSDLVFNVAQAEKRKAIEDISRNICFFIQLLINIPVF